MGPRVGFELLAYQRVGTAAGGFETNNGGKSWRPSTLAPKAKIRVSAADGTPMVYAIGSEVQIYR